VPFTDKTRKAALQLLKSGELRIHEVADLAGISRQGIYRNLDLNDIDLDGCRVKHVRKRWREKLREIE
jgi:Winged helix-turn helix